MNNEIRTEAINKVADEIYAVLEAASHFMNEGEAKVLAKKVDEISEETFGIVLWREVTYKGM